MKFNCFTITDKLETLNKIEIEYKEENNKGLEIH